MELWTALIVAASAVLTGPLATVVVAWVSYRIRSRERAEELARTNGKLNVIHTLVNSNMTAAMQSEYDATLRELAMMREVIALKQVAGRAPSHEALTAIEVTGAKINELKATLSDRLEQTKVAVQQTKEG